MYVCTFGPFRSINIDEKCPNVQSTSPCNNSFLMICFRIFRSSSINIEVSGYGGSKKYCVFAGTYFHVRIICMCFIERIRFYVHGSRVLFVRKRPNCELFGLYVCMDVWSWCFKTLSFYTRFPCPCTPPHERAKNVSKRSPGVHFHGGFGRVSF